MCCEDCINYGKCEESNRLRDDCCAKCSEYYSCAGVDERERDSFRYSYRDDNDEEDYFSL